MTVRTALVAVAATWACCAGAQSSLDGAKVQPISVCEIAGDEARFQGEELLVTGRIVNVSPHGMYALDDACPDAYLWISAGTDSDGSRRETLAKLYQVSLPTGPDGTSGWATFRARVEMANYQVPLTNDVHLRLVLRVLDVIEVPEAD